MSISSSIPTRNRFYPLEDKPKSKEEAAVCIQRAWRRSRAGIDMISLGKDLPVVARMPHSRYKTFCEHYLSPALQKGIALPRRKKDVATSVMFLKIYRKRCQKDQVVLCTSIWGENGFPVVRMAEKSELPQHGRQIGEIYLSESAQKQFARQSAMSLRDTDELDRIVSALYRLSDIVPWAYREDGCYARARFMNDFLILAGVPKKNLAKQYVFLPQDKQIELENDSYWIYHVAPLITLRDGSSWILDPGLSPDRPLKLKEWFARQKEHPEEPLTILDKGYLHIPPGKEMFGKVDPKGKLGMTFTAGPFSSVDVNDEREYTVIDGASDEEEVLADFADYRAELEKPLLKDFV